MPNHLEATRVSPQYAPDEFIEFTRVYGDFGSSSISPNSEIVDGVSIWDWMDDEADRHYFQGRYVWSNDNSQQRVLQRCFAVEGTAIRQLSNTPTTLNMYFTALRRNIAAELLTQYNNERRERAIRAESQSLWVDSGHRSVRSVTPLPTSDTLLPDYAQDFEPGVQERHIRAATRNLSRNEPVSIDLANWYGADTIDRLVDHYAQQFASMVAGTSRNSVLAAYGIPNRNGVIDLEEVLRGTAYYGVENRITASHEVLGVTSCEWQYGYINANRQTGWIAEVGCRCEECWTGRLRAWIRFTYLPTLTDIESVIQALQNNEELPLDFMRTGPQDGLVSETTTQEASQMPRQTRRQPEDRVARASGRTYRRCPDCGLEYPLTDDIFRYDGRQNTYRNQCRDCERAAMRERARLRRAGTTGSQATRNRRTAQATRNRRAAENTRDRAWGIEIELTAPTASRLERALQDAGINVINTGSYGATNGNRWEIKTDCSVNGQGLELVSPKLRGENGFEQLQTVCRVLREVGAVVDRSCGVHVHVDFRQRSLEEIKWALLPMLDAQSLITQFVAPSRRRNSYCPQWTAEDIATFRSHNSLTYAMGTGPRGFINFWSYTRHGSIEFRGHAGSRRYDRLGAWVRFLLAAVKHGERTQGRTLGSTPEDVLANVRVSQTDATALLRFVTAERQAAEAVELADLTQESVTV